MPQFNELERPRINIDVGYQINILALSQSKKDLLDNKDGDFTEKIAKDASLKGRGTHHLKVDGVIVKYKVILTTLSTPTKWMK